MSPSTPDFAIVIAAKDEGDNLADVVNEIAEVVGATGFEVVVVDDGSTDETAQVLRDLSRQHAFLRHLRHDHSCGKSAAILTAVRAARAPRIVTMDGDGQNDPRFVLPLLEKLEPGTGLVAGQRIRHAHSSIKRIGSRMANGLRAAMLKDSTRDTACGLKAFPRDVFLKLPYFDTMHRFLPALVLREGLAVRHIDVTDRPRVHGVSKYGVWDRLLVGILDLCGVWWLIRRRKNVPDASEA
jgi:glycosyltransferase involved in cell wall biosynthesis